MILPDRVFGNASVKRISSGRASAPISFVTCARSSWFNASDAVMRAFERHESHHRRSLQLVRTRDDGRLRDCAVRHERALNFRRSESMSAYIYNIIDPAHYPEIAVPIAARAVAGEIDALDLRPVLLFVTLVIAPDRPQHRWPRSLDDQITAFTCSNRLAVTCHHVSIDAGKRQCTRARLCWSRTRKRSDHDRAGFSLPPRVDNRAALLADDLAIPHPRFGIDRFADCAE